MAIANALQLEAARRRAVPIGPIRFNFVARAKFEVAQPIRCRLRAFLLLIRYVGLPKKHRPWTFHPFVGVVPLNRLTCRLGCWMNDVPYISAKFYVSLSRGFLGAAPPKVPFPIIIRTPLTTVFCTPVQTVINGSIILIIGIRLFYYRVIN